MTTRPTQMQMYYAVSFKIAECNQMFLQLVRDGLTREELEKLIAKRPSLWGKYEGFLSRLPTK